MNYPITLTFSITLFLLVNRSTVNHTTGLEDPQSNP